MKNRKLLSLRFLVFGVGWLGAMSLLVWSLWNHLVPAIFHLREISFLEGLGLLLLSRILFGGFRSGRPWMQKARWARGWKNLSPEDRERFRAAMGAGRRCGPVEQ